MKSYEGLLVVLPLVFRFGSLLVFRPAVEAEVMAPRRLPLRCTCT